LICAPWPCPIFIGRGDRMQRGLRAKQNRHRSRILIGWPSLTCPRNRIELFFFKMQLGENAKVLSIYFLSSHLLKKTSCRLYQIYLLLNVNARMGCPYSGAYYFFYICAIISSFFYQIYFILLKSRVTSN
jgi:hypothetical protein